MLVYYFRSVARGGLRLRK